MLQIIRDKLTGWVAIVIFIFIGLAFALWGIDLGGANLNYAAKVNGEDISLDDFRLQHQNQLARYAQSFSDGVPAEIEEQLRQSVLNGMIREELLSQKSREFNYRVGNLAVAEAIQNTPAFQVDGEFSLDLYRARLAANGLSPAGYEASIRQSLRNAQLRSGIAGSTFVTPAELRRFVALQDQKREAAWAIIPVGAYAQQAEVSEDAIVEEYESNPDAYQSPETVSIQYLLLPRGEIDASIQVSEAELKEFYDQERSVGRFGGVEERRARHILIAVDSDTDDATAKSLADAALARINAGEDFAALAAEISDDPGSKADGGDLGFADPEIFVPPFKEALLNLQPGEIAGPVRTQFGYHIIRLEGINDAADKTFAEVRDELLAELRARKSEEEFYQRAGELRDLTFKAFNELESVAEDMGLELKTLEGITRTSGPGIAASPRLRDAAFSDPVLLDSENSDSIDLDEGAVVLRVSSHQPAALRPLAEVRAQIESKLSRAQAEKLAAEAGRMLVEKTEMTGALSAEGLPEAAVFSDTRVVARREADVSPQLLDAIFAAPAPGAGNYVNGLTLANGDYAVFALKAVRPGDIDALSETERAQRERQLASIKGNIELTAYIEELRREASIIINEEQLQ